MSVFPMNDIRSVAIAFKVWSRCSKVSFSIFHLKDTLCSPDRFLWCGWCAARRLLVFRCEFDDFDGNPTQFTPLNTSWWQSLVQVLRGCAELLPLLCGATTTNTILQSYFYHYCAELLYTSTTIVQSFYFYSCCMLALHVRIEIVFSYKYRLRGCWRVRIAVELQLA